ncbi:MAG: hypothetical protein NTY70_19920, partial [Burkholderiales bacterium]|nr:hypothetical protein [Burkholderiales bacterium]
LPGARITATTFDGRVIEVANFPGKYGFTRLMEASSKKAKEGGVHEITWTNGGVSVAINLKVISMPNASTDNASPQGKGFRGMKLPEAVLGAPTLAAATAAVTAPAIAQVSSASNATGAVK